jgi:dolichol kinase
MIIPDLIRVLWGPEHSIFHLLTKAVLRKKEYNAVGPQIYLVTGVIFSYILYMFGIVHILIFFAGVLIACFSDALAALIGRSFGTHEVKCLGDQIKTVEGFIAGIGSAYLIGFFTIGPIYAFFGAIIFFLLDYFPTLIADNILNPIIITLTITILYLILPFPIGLF